MEKRAKKEVAVKNALVAQILYDIADRLDLEGIAFKPRAYRRAAREVESLATPIEDLVATGKHVDLPGVGAAIAKKIEEVVQTGHLQYHDQLRKRLPIDLRGLTQVDGVGPRTAKLLYEALGIRTLEDLASAVASGRLAAIKGLGEKSQQKIARGLSETRAVEGRILLGRALPMAERLVERLHRTGLFERLQFAGSLRRGQETVGDLDLLGVSRDPRAAAAAFVALPEVADVLAHGEKRASILLDGGIQVDLRLVPDESYGAALQYFTGSKAHNIALRRRAVSRRWKLNEYALFDEQDRPLAGHDEEGIYARLGLCYVPAELRENAGEIEAAATGRLPALVSAADLLGDFHVHTEASDGTASLPEMIAAARSAGLSYIAVTDHARFSNAIGGLTPEQVRRQSDDIGLLNESLQGFRVLTGIEANIRPDGELDVAAELLARLDVVIASVHDHFHQAQADMTARLVRACRNEHVDILGHPTGRKIGERPPIKADWDAVFESAASNSTALEINANPIRLDLDAGLVRRAIAAGCKLSIGSDAHAPEHFAFLRLGVLTARRGWATAANLWNTQSETTVRRRR